MTFRKDAKRFTEEYLVWSGKAQSTRSGYARHLRDFADYVENTRNAQLYTDEITLEDLEAYLFHLRTERGLMASSVGKHLACLKSFFKYAQRSGLRGDNPAALIVTPKVPKRLPVFLEPEEVERVIAEIKRPEVQGAAWVMYLSGLRVSEAVNLKLEDLDFGRKQLMVRNGKGNKDRLLPLSGRLTEILLRYLQDRRPETDSPYLFPARNGALSVTYVSRVIRIAAVRAGITRRVTSHTLRHSFATNLYRRGVGLREIGSLLGHTSLVATEVYTHLGSDDLEKAVNLL